MALLKKLRGARVTVTNSLPDTDRGEAHSRLWVQFLRGAVDNLQEELKTAEGERRKEILLDIEDKQREISLHERMYPSSRRDAVYLATHTLNTGE